MTTIWTHAHEQLTERIYSTPGRKALIEDSYKKVPDPFRAFTYQHRSKRPTIADKEVAVEFITGLFHGWMAVAIVDVGDGPGPDADHDGNNKILAQAPPPFWADFDNRAICGMLDCDGFVGWDEPVFMTAGGKDVEIPPRCVPLEVGYMPSAKAVYGMRITGLARWPYGSNSLCIAVPLFPEVTVNGRFPKMIAAPDPQDIAGTHRES